MCGIAGALGPLDRIQTTLAEVRTMIGRLDRRGPDGAGFGTFEGVALGHARLAIIDLSTGDQPQSTMDESVVVVVNGEIYNYVELRSELEARGHQFRTQSDIEVIPHLYQELGESFVDKLRGMFAIALYDRRSRAFYLVRDRLGKKPIYWRIFEGRLYFASELKALLGLAQPFTLNSTAVDEFFTYQYVPAPRSVFSEVSKVPAGCWVRFQDGTVETREYWRPNLEVDHGITLDDAVARVDDILREATRIRLRSDVPLGAFLSGGIDSNLVVSSATSLLGGALKTTTIGFGPDNESEVEAARRMAAFFKSDHHEKHLADDVSGSLTTVTDYLDEPLGDSSTLPTYLVSKAARENVTVALSGDGGDETFGGYAWRYRQNLFLERWRRRLGPWIRRALIAPIAAAYPKADRWPKSLRWKWGLRNLSVDAEEAYFLDMSIFRPEDKHKLFRPEFAQKIPSGASRQLFDTWFARVRDRDLLSQLLYVDLKTYLADGVLAKVDRMSMANSLEVRSPLLDQVMVEFALGLPPHLKIHGSESKYVLRRLAAQKLGDVIAGAPKRGFAPPIEGWLRRELAPMFRDVCLKNPAGLGAVIDVVRLGRYFEDHVAGRSNHARVLWISLNFELWCRRFGRGAAGF